MDLTTRLGLKKPAGNEDYTVDIPNYNSDRLDTYFGLIVCTSSTRPSSPPTGVEIFETDTGLTYYWDGAAWVRISVGLMGGYRYDGANATLTTMANNTTEQLSGMETPTLTLPPDRCYKVTFMTDQDDVTSGKLTLRIRETNVSGTIWSVRGPITQRAVADRQQETLEANIITGGSAFVGKFVLTAQRAATNATVPHFYKNTATRPFSKVEYLGPAALLSSV